MRAKIMDNRALAEEIAVDIRSEVKDFAKHRIQPCLATFLVGDDPASHNYLKRKHEACGRVGIKSINLELPAASSEDEVLRQIGLKLTPVAWLVPKCNSVRYIEDLTDLVYSQMYLRWR